MKYTERNIRRSEDFSPSFCWACGEQLQDCHPLREGGALLRNRKVNVCCFCLDAVYDIVLVAVFLFPKKIRGGL